MSGELTEVQRQLLANMGYSAPGMSAPPPPPPDPKSLLSPSEYLFYMMGLGTPMKRFMFGFVVTESLMFLLKPVSILDEKGNIDLMKGHWWFMPGLVVGGLFATFL